METIVINKKKIAPGENKVVRLNVAHLHSGNKIDIQVHVFRSKKPGPTMLVLGGVHGDEINGVEIVRQTIADRMFENLEKGSVIAIPLLNIYGFLNFSRDLPDGKDVNRSFPGMKSGSLASRVAHTMTKQILPVIDFGVDFHTGGASRFNYPQIRYTPDDVMANDLARSFAPPFLIPSKIRSGSLRHAAKLKNIPILIFEGGESLRVDQFSINEGINGLKRMMLSVGMIKDAPMHKQTTLLHKKSWVRASRSGMFRWIRQSGDSIEKGEIMGVIHDPYGQWSVDVTANRSGTIFGHNNAPVVNQGDAVFHIGYEEEIIKLD